MDLVLNELQVQVQKLREEHALLEQENADLSARNRQLLDSLEEQTSEESIRDWDAMEILERHYRDLVVGTPSAAADAATDRGSQAPLASSLEAADEAAGGGIVTPRTAPWLPDVACCRSPEGCTAPAAEAQYFRMSTPKVNKDCPESPR
jgi:hypothetical protein